MEVRIHYPETEEGMKIFEDRLAQAIADVVLLNINKLDRTPEYKNKMVDEAIEFIKRQDSRKISLKMLQDAAARELEQLERVEELKVI